MSLIVCNEQTHEETKAFLMEKLELVKRGRYGEFSRSNTDSRAALMQEVETEEDIAPSMLTSICRKLFPKKRKFDKDTIVDAEV
jgi:hypothetical protein